MHKAWMLIPFLCFPALLIAQQASTHLQEHERAKQLLHSSDWADKAWGAYLAGRLRTDDLNAELIAQLQTVDPASTAAVDRSQHAYITVLLDALIVSGASVPASVSERFVTSWKEAAIILLARDSQSDEALLRLHADQPRQAVWLAVNNLLAARRSAAWYAALLTEVQITNRFTVAEPGTGSVAGGQGGGMCGDGSIAMPKGFPTVAIYEFTSLAQPGDVLFVNGPQSVYYRTVMVPPDRQVGTGTCDILIDRAKIRIGYLAQLPGDSRAVAERLFNRETSVPYQAGLNFEDLTRKHLDLQESEIREYVNAIAANGLAVPKVNLRIIPEINDQRRDRTIPLPIPPPREIALP